MSKIEIGIVGLGGNGCNWLKYYLENPQVEVVAICDISRKLPPEVLSLAGGEEGGVQRALASWTRVSP